MVVVNTTYVSVPSMNSLVLRTCPATGEMWNISSHFGIVLTYTRLDHPMPAL